MWISLFFSVHKTGLQSFNKYRCNKATYRNSAASFWLVFIAAVAYNFFSWTLTRTRTTLTGISWTHIFTGVPKNKEHMYICMLKAFKWSITIRKKETWCDCICDNPPNVVKSQCVNLNLLQVAHRLSIFRRMSPPYEKL